MPNKNWITVSLKKKLVNEIDEIAKIKVMQHTTLINQVLWNYIDQWKLRNVNVELKSLLAEAKKLARELKALKGEP